MSTDPMAWQKDGVCATPREGADWFARKNGQAARAAKRWCAVCPVRDACLTFALTDPGILEHIGLEGIWGGTDEQERAWLKDPAFDTVWDEVPRD
jgi:WhiB family redox-sensing transcriptional regulator